MTAQTDEDIPLGESEERFDTIILGAGISGLVSASILAKKGKKSILLLDEFDHIGGNHISISIGSFTFDIGSLIFQDDSPLINHFPQLLPYYLPIRPSWGKLTPKGKVVRYPISVKDDIFKNGLSVLLKIFGSLIFWRLFRRPIKNAKTYASYWIGSYFLRCSGLEHYMTRFFGVPAEEIDIAFAEKRMYWIREQSSIIGVLKRVFSGGASSSSNQQLVRPASGFRELYAVIESQLCETGVRFELGKNFVRVEKKGGLFVIITNEKRYIAKQIISTIPLSRAADICSVAAPSIMAVTILSLFFSFSGSRKFRDNILYNFDNQGAWKRITMYSDFYGFADDREYFTVEVLASQVENRVDIATRDFSEHVMARGLFEGDLRLEGSKTIPNAYPIYTAGARQEADITIARLRDLGIVSFGRQGGFDYQPTARVSTLVAERQIGDMNNAGVS